MEQPEEQLMEPYVPADRSYCVYIALLTITFHTVMLSQWICWRNLKTKMVNLKETLNTNRMMTFSRVTA